MSFVSIAVNIAFRIGDFIRDFGITTPEGIKTIKDIDYVNFNNKYNRLDIYHSEVADSPMPIIVSVHGGGWVYGNKEIYRHYCMSLAKLGFAIINFNYRLAPRHKYPTALYDVNSLFAWLKENHVKYNLDINNIFVVGDSAGAQLAAQYATILTNDEYRKLLNFKTPNIKINGMALNCGLLDPMEMVIHKKNFHIKVLLIEYVGKDFNKQARHFNLNAYITKEYPPVFIACSTNDILVGCKPSMLDFLSGNSVQHVYKEYGQTNKSLKHVFNLDIKSNEANDLNLEQIQFFRRLLITNS